MKRIRKFTYLYKKIPKIKIWINTNQFNINNLKNHYGKQIQKTTKNKQMKYQMKLLN